MLFYLGFLFFICLSTFGNSASFPTNLQRCNRKSEDFDACLMNAITDAFHKLSNGSKELSIPVLDPVYIPSATIASGSGPVNVEQKYTNMEIFYITRSKIEQLKSKITDNSVTLSMKVSSPEYVLKADYDFNGRILLLPIVGVGKCAITLSDINTEWTLAGEIVERKGNQYLDIREFKVTLNPKLAHFDFQNLFGGDERLGKEINAVLNENWKDVYEDVKEGYEELIGSVGKSISKQIFSKVPIKEIFLE